jgi:hypothetical protein
MNMNIEHFRHLHAVAKQIVDDPHSADADLAAALKSATLKLAERYSNPQYALETLYAGETELGDLLRRAVAIVGTDKIAKARPRDSAAGAHGLAAALSEHLIDRLADLRGKHGFEKTAKKDAPPMDSIHSIMKSGGIASVCAAIVAKGSTSVSEEDIVSAVGKTAVEQRWPELSEAQAFARIYTASTEEARVLQKAISIAKLSVFDVKPIEVGGEDAYTVSELTAAVRASEEIVRIGREKFPFLSAAQQYARIFEAEKYAVLAAQAHQRPEPTTIYEMPRSTGPGAGRVYKADPAPNADAAYDVLMVKAAELRKAQPHLSEAQAFAKVFTDPANIELAKRERIESAPR